MQGGVQEKRNVYQRRLQMEKTSKEAKVLSRRPAVLGFVVGWLGVGLCGWALCLKVFGVGLGIFIVCISIELFLFQRIF